MLNIKKVIKSFLPKSFKFKFYSTFGKDYSSQLSVEKKNKVFIMLAADYGNLGDIAITVAQTEFIKITLPDHQVIPMYYKDTIKMLKTMRKLISEDDIITLIGGGNMGDLYEGFEELRRNIIVSFPKNKIISFPQTIDFSNSEKGRESFGKTIKYYNKNKNLHLFAREFTSFETMKSQFNNKVSIVPDIVLSYPFEAGEKTTREGIIFCLRDDLEAKLNLNTKNKIISVIKSRYEKVSFLDTHLGRDDHSVKVLDELFQSLLKEFARSKLVITDRLHGMIFCVITGTPCIVLPNTNHKIIGTYNDWLKEIDYIRLMSNLEDFNLFLENVESLLSINNDDVEIPNLNPFFKDLKESLKK